MSRFLRSTAVAALAAAALGAVATAATAQSYDRLVVFGDSLSDNGNLYARTGGASPASPPYFQGRFSNGPVFTELLGFNAGRAAAGASVNGSINYAYGGARTDSSVFNPFVAPPTIDGMRTQLATYLGAGGTFGPNDLVSVLGGANNIFQAIPGAGASANPFAAITPTVNAAAADVNFIVNSVANAGAGTILVSNLPRLGITPQFNQGPGAAASPLADYAGQNFNTALLSGLRTVAAGQPDTNIIYVDLYRVSDPLATNPGLFGLTNTRDACFNQTTLTVCANPDSYLYWDGVHPTAAGHRLFASLVNDYLYYGDQGAHTTVLGETAFRQREDLLDMAVDAVGARDSWNEGTRMTFAVIGDTVDTDSRGAVSEAEVTGWGGRVGLDHVMSDRWRFGIAGTFRTAEIDAGPLQADVETYGFDAYAGWRSGSLFANAALGGSIDQYDEVTRQTALAGFVHSTSTDGGSIGGRLQGGAWFDMGGIALSPRVAVNWVRTNVNDFAEQGLAAEYVYADRTLEGVTGEVSLRAEGGGEGLSFFAEGGYRDSLDDNFDPVRVGIAGNTAQTLAIGFDDPFSGSMIASAGVEADVGFGRVSLGYRGRFGDSADSHMGALKLSIPLQ